MTDVERVLEAALQLGPGARAAIAAELYGYRGKVVRQTSGDADYLVDNPNRRCPIITKARTELGYEPKIDLEEGLLRSMIWYGGNRQGAA